MFQVGQKVMCVDAEGMNDGGLCPLLVEGGIYIIRELPAHPLSGNVGVRLEGVVSRTVLGVEWAYRATRFRSLTDIGIFHEIARKVTKKKRVAANTHL